MRKNEIPELDKLFIEIGTYRKSNELKELYEFVKKFPQLAPFNAMLIHVQKPGSQYVASVRDWAIKFGRTIKPTARPLVILRPFGPVSFVFELGDTEGQDPFPNQLLEPFKTEGQKVSDWDFSHLVDSLKNDGIEYSEGDYGTYSAGFIQISNRNKELKITKSNKEIWVKSLYELVSNKNHEKETRFATILHELGHLYCGHLGTPNEKWWKSRIEVEGEAKEFEAESVCWLICERMGIENPSAEYLSGYLDYDGEVPNISIDAVLKSVAIIESMIKGKTEPRKELIKRIENVQAVEQMRLII